MNAMRKDFQLVSIGSMFSCYFPISTGFASVFHVSRFYRSSCSIYGDQSIEITKKETCNARNINSRKSHVNWHLMNERSKMQCSMDQNETLHAAIE